MPTPRPLWLPPAEIKNQLSPIQTHWLTRPGALTEGLRALGTIKLNVNREYVDTLGADEAVLVQGQPKATVWAREIIIKVDSVPCMVARSVCHLADASDAWREIRDLGVKPLAELLYHDPAVTRDPFFISFAHASLPIYAAVSYYLGQPAPVDTCVARSSVFWLAEKPLLVSECFLPEFWTLLAKKVDPYQ